MQKNTFEHISVYGAKEHNLKNIDVQIPKNKLVVLTGISGSGKSSLAFDTVYAEGQRRYLETFSAYVRQFIGNLKRPDVDKISGLSPVISIEQKTINRNVRSTVGTITEVYDFLRLLFAKVGKPYSYNTNKLMIQMNEKQMAEEIYKQFANKQVLIMTPLIKGRKGHYKELFIEWQKKGYERMYVDKKIIFLDGKVKIELDRFKIHDIDLILDDVMINTDNTERIAASIDHALKLSKGFIYILCDNKITQWSKNIICADTGISYEEPSPNTFSFNSPYGYCPHCKGIGTVLDLDMSKIIDDDNLSISEGGIVPFGKQREGMVFERIIKMAKKLKISLDAPLSKIPKDILNFILWDYRLEGYDNYNKNVTQEQIHQHIQRFEKVNIAYEGVCNYILKQLTSTENENTRIWAEGFMSEKTCPHCNGMRLKKESLWFKIDNKNIGELSAMSIEDLAQWFIYFDKLLSAREKQITAEILKEINERLSFLLNVGLGYLNLNLPAKTLSGGESQRIRLATQISSKLKGITYILDEPSIGLHQRDNAQLITALRNLVNLGNTVLVVEHDKEIMMASDYIIDIGPGAGHLGGTIIAQGHPNDFIQIETHTTNYLSNRKIINIDKTPLTPPNTQQQTHTKLPTKKKLTAKETDEDNIKTLSPKEIILKGASGNNLKNIDVTFPLGKLIVVTGVSGSGKSTLIEETLYPILQEHYTKNKQLILPYKSISGLEHIDKVIEIDQSPIGRTPRSNPATYCGFFTDIRELFASLPEARAMNFKVGRFSFNVAGGRCEKCQGDGEETIQMGFLPDVYVTCPECQGKRYNKPTLTIKYKGKSIYDVLNMSVDDAVVFFEAIPNLYRKVKFLQDVGLGYITLGQSSVTLSGGEAQRIKLATELSKRDTGKTFYILDEPSTGLHFKDIDLLMQILYVLVKKGNTVVIIEHNLDIIKLADYIIDIGPEGGKRGGEVVAIGTPQDIAKNPKSITGKFLKAELDLLTK